MGVFLWIAYFSISLVNCALSLAPVIISFKKRNIVSQLFLPLPCPESKHTTHSLGAAIGGLIIGLGLMGAAVVHRRHKAESRKDPVSEDTHHKHTRGRAD